MTKDLRNIYNNLFKYLRKELPPEEASDFLKEAGANSNVAEDLDTFRAAKVLIEENELLDFRRAAEGYSKELKLKKLYLKVIVAVLAVITGVVVYILLTDDSNSSDKPVKVQEQQINHEKRTLVEVNNDTVDQKPSVEVQRQPKKATELVREEDKAENNNEKITSNNTLKETKIVHKTDNVNIKQELPDTDTSSTPVQVGLKLAEEIHSPEPEEKESGKEFKALEKRTEPEVIEHKEETRDDYFEDNMEDIPFAGIEERKDPCDINMPETYEPRMDSDIILIVSAVFDGNLVIYNEYMKEVFKLSFFETDEVRWDGRGLNDEYVPMGIYKVLIFYGDGTKCIKDLTILERW